MKTSKSKGLLPCVFVALYCRHAFAENLWESIWGSEADEWLRSAIPTNNGNAFVVAGTKVDSNFLGDIYIAKIDDVSNMLWEATIDIEGFDEGLSVCQLVTGDYAVTGGARGDIECGLDCAHNTAGDACIVLTDDSGGVKWIKRVDHPGHTIGRSITEANNGDLVVVGQRRRASPDINDDVYIIRLSSAGDVAWERTFGGDKNDIGYGIVALEDNDVIVCGKTASDGAGETDIYVLRLNDAGEIAWERTIGGSRSDAGLGICLGYSGDVAVTGFSQIDGNLDVIVVSILLNGELKWSKSFGDPERIDAGYSIVKYKEGFLLGGQSNTTELSSYVARLSKNGQVAAEKRYDKNCAISSIAAASTSVLCGQCRVQGQFGGNQDFYYAIFDLEGWFVRGNPNDDELVDISDGVFVLRYLFMGEDGPLCLDALDTNDDGKINVTDPIYLFGHLFQGGMEIPPPHESPGLDPTPDHMTECSKDC